MLPRIFFFLFLYFLLLFLYYWNNSFLASARCQIRNNDLRLMVFAVKNIKREEASPPQVPLLEGGGGGYFLFIWFVFFRYILKYLKLILFSVFFYYSPHKTTQWRKTKRYYWKTIIFLVFFMVAFCVFKVMFCTKEIKKRLVSIVSTMKRITMHKVK